MKKLFLLLALCFSLLLESTTPTWAVAHSAPLKIDATGPGQKIAGMDISVYQHPGGSKIDFRQMHAAGIRFVIIKGGDSYDRYDQQALSYFPADRKAAQAASLYTSFYYYATLPDSTSSTVVMADAKAQAQKIIWRIASLGGYNRRDLPVALDLENNCVRLNSAGNCARYTTPTLVSLWAQTWLDTLTSATGRKPFIYSYPQFLESAMVRSTSLRQYPLWIARYGPSATLTSQQLNSKNIGCYAHSWSNADCSTQWQIWQYTSCGIPGKYGVPGSRVDLNIFNGSSRDFMNLIRGIWQPDSSQMLPLNEPTTMTITNQRSATTNDPVTIGVNVVRPDGTPVVAGTVNFTPASTMMATGQQSALRSSSGVWTLTITGLSAGRYLGTVNFIDATQTEAPAQFPVVFEVAQGATPTPTPTPPPSTTPSTTTKPKPADPCSGQIRN
jgi:GH25 family lysozyme M1 (1,4-beta-N-acetylmuramidase)